MKRRDLLTDIRSKDSTQLGALIKEAEQKLLTLRFDAAFRKLKKVQDMHIIRKQIARYQTILREKLREETDQK